MPKWTRRRRRLLFCVFVFFAVLFIQWIWRFSGQRTNLSKYLTLLETNLSSVRKSSFVGIFQNGDCVIPILDPWDPTIRRFVETAKPLECRPVQPTFSFLTNGFLWINESSMRESGFSSIQCFRRCFDRETDERNRFAEWSLIKNGEKIDCEFVEVDCRRRLPPLSVYNRFHSQILPIDADTKTQRTKFDVELFVLDSVSQSHWRRGLFGTLQTLQTLFNSTVLSGFNKVADNSFPNAIAFLSGMKEMENQKEEKYFDEWPLIWKDFQKEGYATFYAEDYPDFNLFNYLNRGFHQKPVDHYFRPFWKQLYLSFVYRRSQYLCYNEKPMHRIQLDYFRQFLQKYYNRRPFFALNWLTELAHDWLSQVSAADGDISEMFSAEEENLSESFLFVFSDHGHRFDPIRQTMIGRLEERMPFFSVAVPKTIRQKFPIVLEILQENAERLSSFFDLYITLRDIIDLQKRSAWKELNERKQPIERFRRISPFGLSLLRPLPSERQCADAGIPDEYCICQTEKPISINEPVVIRAADELVRHTNRLLTPECSPLSIREIRSAQISLPNDRIVRGNRRALRLLSADNGLSNGLYVNILLMMEMSPSGALIEAIVRHYISDDSLRVVGDVNRINRYGNQSVCVRDAKLRKLCFCR